MLRIRKRLGHCRGRTAIEQSAWFKLAKPVKLQPEDKVEITLSFESKTQKSRLKELLKSKLVVAKFRQMNC